MCPSNAMRLLSAIQCKRQIAQVKLLKPLGEHIIDASVHKLVDFAYPVA
jgi:hypothetical protein